MIDIFTYHPQPPDDERRRMSPATAERIMATIETGALADAECLNSVVSMLAHSTRLDGWQTLKQFTDSLGDAYELLWDDLDLLRPCLGNEHAIAVMDGSEIDYAPLFYDEPEILKSLRLTSLLQDSGKVLSVAETGSNFAQSTYNALVAKNILDSIDDNHLSPAAKKAVLLLVGQDIIGGILQSHDIEEKLAQFREAWPPEFMEHRDDLMLAAYLSDASAHSAYRLYRNIRSGFTEPAVRPDDAQLTFLFERHKSGALTLTRDRCELLLETLPGVNRLRYLLTGELGQYARDDEVFAEVIAQKLGRHATDAGRIWLRDPGEFEEDIVKINNDPRFGATVRVTTTYESRSDFATERLYYLPGDGQIWERINHVSSILPNNSLFEHIPQPSQYQHPDIEVARLQQQVLLRVATIEGQTIGRPLPPKEAWAMINYTENLL